MTQKQKEGVFIANLNKAKLLPYFCTFYKIKYLGVDTFSEREYINSKGQTKFKPLIADFSGGFIKYTDCKQASKKLNIHYTTFRRHIKKLVELGWLKKTFTGYRLVGKSVLFEEYGNGLKRLSLAGETRKEVIDEVAYNLIKTNIKQQAYKESIKNGTRRKYSNALVNTPLCTISVRWLQKQLGYKSPMSALRVEKSLEKNKKIIIQKRSQVICHKDNFDNYVLGNPDILSRCFYKDKHFHERLCNNIVISFKTKDDYNLIAQKKQTKDRIMNQLAERMGLSMD